MVTPAWGLVSTQSFSIGDPYARAVNTIYENGAQAHVSEFHENTPWARTVELSDRHGRAKERSVRTPQAGVWAGMPYDLVETFSIGPWGQTALKKRMGILANSELEIFADSAERRTMQDFSQPYDAPRYAVDLTHKAGVNMPMYGMSESNVVQIFQTELLTNQAALQIDEINLTGLFGEQVTRKLVGRDGHIIEERVGRIPSPGDKGFWSGALFAVEPQFYKFVTYRYDPGWLIESGEVGQRQFAFETSAPPARVTAFRCNDQPFPDIASAVITSHTTADSKLDSNLIRRFVARRLQRPRILESNPYMPRRKSIWTAWTATELKYNGDKQFGEEQVYDAEGRLCVAKASKKTFTRASGTKIRYLIPPLEKSELTHSLNDALDIAIITDCSESDWLYLQASGSAGSRVALELTDAKGHQVRIAGAPTNTLVPFVRWWPIEERLTRWVPEKSAPEQIIELASAPSLDFQQSTLAVSVHDLARAGLDIRHISRARLKPLSGPKELAVSDLHYLKRLGEFVALTGGLEPEQNVEVHSSGLKTIFVTEKNRTVEDVQNGRGILSAVDWNGMPVATAEARSRHSAYPPLILKDHSDGDLAQLLYAISPEDGHFLEHYKNVRLGDAQIYTVVHGFDLPRMEIYQGRFLDDEAAPSLLYFGKDYRLNIEIIKARNAFESLLGLLHNRVAANSFNLLGGTLLGYNAYQPELTSHYNFSELHRAGRQSAAIQRLPTLAEALLPLHSVPWETDSVSTAPRALEHWKKLQFVLGKLHLQNPTGLIPAAPGAGNQRYVQTVREADIISLALHLGELALARELLDFYWEKSEGGQKALHDSYDAEMGTAMALDLRYSRPVHSRRTSEAQLAIAEAAFSLGFQSSDSKYLTFGRNLLHLTLQKYRPSELVNGPRGITEEEFQPPRQTFGVVFWPDGFRCTLRSNARACLLLKRLTAIVPQRFKNDGWILELQAALGEEENWLRSSIVADAEKTGVVTSGTFAIQDIHHHETELAQERWSTTEDWLWFLEAAHEMQLPTEDAKRWLANLARVHGVWIGKTWGLDWQVPVLRSDAISPELTARFMRVANMVGDTTAEQFAQSQLQLQRQGLGFPEVITTVPHAAPLRLAKNQMVFPITKGQSSPLIFGVEKEILERARPGWDLSRANPKLETKPIQEVWPAQHGDLTFLILVAASFYVSVLASMIFWWRFRALRRKEKTASPVSEDMVPEKVSQYAEVRWSKRVLGVTCPALAEKTRYSNAPV
ncbi:MAG TPA: hypothetical protein VGE41_06940, partial [Verrucomicrobiae bacterium]